MINNSTQCWVVYFECLHFASGSRMVFGDWHNTTTGKMPISIRLHLANPIVFYIVPAGWHTCDCDIPDVENAGIDDQYNY
jgi:hypothetical protein